MTGTFARLLDIQDLADLSSVRKGASSLLNELRIRQPAPGESDAGELEGLSGPWEDIAREGVEEPPKPGPFTDISAGRVDVLLLNAATATAERDLVEDSEDQSVTKADGTRDPLRDSKGRYEKTACVNHVGELMRLLDCTAPLNSRS